MLRPVLAALVAIPLLVPAADAGQGGTTNEPTPKPQAWDAAPPKDCTRVNGRYGYYGNQWCTPAEQERWDRWEANRLTRR